MIMTSDNKVLTVNGKALQKKVNSLSFETNGTSFPKYTKGSTNGFFSVTFNIVALQRIQINYGDGNIVTYTSSLSAGGNAITLTSDGLIAVGTQAQHIRQPHTYTDGNSGTRTITVTFEDILTVRILNTQRVFLSGVYPKDLLYLENLTSWSLSGSLGITSFPTDLSRLKKLNSIGISGSSSVLPNKIPDSFFDLPLVSLDLSYGFDLSNLISSNLFKMNQLKDLTGLRVSYCNIKTVDETFKELVNITDLRIEDNPFTAFPTEILSLVKLTILYIGVNGIGATNMTLPLMNLPKLELLHFRGDYDLSDFAVKFSGMTSLGQFSLFSSFVPSTKFNQFIDQMYILATTNASIIAGGAAAPYPNRFRNMLWGHASYTFTGTKVAPTGYVQGSNNGTPTNQGEKLYVLQNQYNHVISHA